MDRQGFDPGIVGGDVTAIMVYAPCRHGWRTKARDWIRRRRHPGAHVVYAAPVYPVGTIGDQIRVSWTVDGTFRIDE